MQAEKLREYIWQGIRKEVYPDRVELYIPFFFGNDQDEPLCLTWDKDCVLSDGGRTLSELKKRVGDIAPLRQTISNILEQQDVALVGGQKLVITHYNTCVCGEEAYLNYVWGLNRMLAAISQISIADIIRVSENGEVSLCG